MKVGDGRMVVTAAGTRERLTADSTFNDPGGIVRAVAITALEGNTGMVVVGGPAVVAALATRRGTPLAAGETIVLETDDLADVYVDAVVSGEGVSFTFTYPAS